MEIEFCRNSAEEIKKDLVFLKKRGPSWCNKVYKPRTTHICSNETMACGMGGYSKSLSGAKVSGGTDRPPELCRAEQGRAAHDPRGRGRPRNGEERRRLRSLRAEPADQAGQHPAAAVTGRVPEVAESGAELDPRAGAGHGKDDLLLLGFQFFQILCQLGDPGVQPTLLGQLQGRELLLLSQQCLSLRQFLPDLPGDGVVLREA